MNTGRRFKPALFLNPGPGHYEELGSVGKGTHTCTNFKSPKVKNIGTTEQRPEWSIHSRFATPGPGTYRPPSDFGYMDMKKHNKTDFNTSVMTGNMGGNFSTTENTSRWENKLATPANYSTIAHSEKKGKPLRAFRNSGFGIDDR